MYVIMAGAEIRDGKLRSFDKDFDKMLDEAITAQTTELRKKYSDQFESELREAESCVSRGDSIGALHHKLQAERINEFLKMLERT